MENKMNVPTIPFKSEFKDLSAFFASTYYDRIEKLINNAQQEIKNNEYLLAEIPLNDNTRITVREFGYYNPTVMRVWGFNSNNENVELLLPTTNIQVILTIKKKDKNKKINPIGFKHDD